MSETIKKATSGRHQTAAGISHLTPDEMLIHAYLHASPSLHVRRTLDQFYYHGIDTDARDQDQVVFRYLEKRKKECKIYMVDQLWLWILGKGMLLIHAWVLETDLVFRPDHHELPAEMAAAEERSFEPSGRYRRGDKFED